MYTQPSTGNKQRHLRRKTFSKQKQYKMKSFLVFALLFAAVVAAASAAPAGDSSVDLEAPKALDKRFKKLAKSVAAAKDGKDKQKYLVERIHLTVVPFRS